MDGVFTHSTNMLIIGQFFFSRGKVSLWESNPNGRNFTLPMFGWSSVVTSGKKYELPKKKKILYQLPNILTSHLTSNCFNILPKSILLLYITITFPTYLTFCTLLSRYTIQTCPWSRHLW